MTESENVKRETGDERISHRLIDGVRVIERETHRIIKVVGSSYVNAANRPAPRLVVVEDQPASFITKDRTSIAGLTAILENAIR